MFWFANGIAATITVFGGSETPPEWVGAKHKPIFVAVQCSAGKVGYTIVFI